MWRRAPKDTRRFGPTSGAVLEEMSRCMGYSKTMNETNGNGRWRSIAGAAAWPLAYISLRLIAPFVTVPNRVAEMTISTVLFLLVPLLWVRVISRWTIPPIAVAGLFLALALIWSETLLLQPFGILRLVDWKAHRAAFSVVLLVSRPFADLALISAGALLGAGLARIISDPKMLLPVALAGGLVDYWGVTMGTTRMAIRLAPEVVTAVSAGIPGFGGGVAGSMEPAAFVGFGDWLFLGLFLAVTHRYSLQPARTFWALLALLIPSMLVVLFGGLSHLPAVVPMAVAVFLVNGRRLRLTRCEMISTMIALALVIGLLVGLFTLWTRLSPPPAPEAPGVPGASSPTP